MKEYQVFYGENEAGKSTIMAFIHGILFGFPTKQQSSELRYEPKHDTKYGGKLRIYHEEFGSVVIERIKGKAAGDVTVIMEDGTTGGEELLKQLLSNIDKGLFQAIFSFNLHGLQNIQQMKGEELGKFLFSTGTLGTERLSKTESVLQYELETRFKPSGKKPALNEKLVEIHNISGELKKAQAKNQQYMTLIAERDEIQQEMEAITTSLHELQQNIEKLKEWKKIQSLVIEQKWIKSEIHQMEDFSFPIRGIERLEKVNQLLLPYNAQIASLVDRIESLNKEKNLIEPNKQILEEESAILALLDQVPLYEQMRLEKQQCEIKLEELIGKITIIKEKLHIPLKEEEIVKVNTNIYMKNQVESVSRTSQKLLEMKQELDQQFREEKTLLIDLEDQVRSAQSKLLTVQERAQLESLVNADSDKKVLESELQTVQDKIEFYRHSKQQDKDTIEKLQKQRRIQFYTIELIMIVLSLYGIFTKQWVLLLIGVLGCLVIGVFLSKNDRKPSTSNTNQLLNQLMEKERKITEKLEVYKKSNIPYLEEKLTTDNRWREHLKVVTIKCEQQQNQFEKVILKLEEWEAAETENKRNKAKLSEELNIPEYIANSFLLEAFQLIEQYKTVVRDKWLLQERMDNIIIEQNKITSKLSGFASKYLGEESIHPQKTAYLLRSMLKEEHEKVIKAQERQAKLDDFTADLQQVKQELAHLDVERLKLFNEADVKSEEEFYNIGTKFEKRTKLLERLVDLEKQLQYTFLKESEWESYLDFHNFDEVITMTNEKTQKLTEHMVSLQEKQASIKYEIQVIEEGGLYSELLHQYKQKKFELEEAAKEWSTYCLAQEILTLTIEKYKNVYLPRMLAKAEEYLAFLTDGNYARIHLQKTGTGFLIERKDHTFFEANELSQATAEQVYVAIRLSLATTIYEKYHFPIIIDDSFVNFDANRTQKVMKLLNTLDKNQLLFFTCHEHLLHHFEQENILYLKNGAVEVFS
ncbi:MAG: hypothetical protein K0Q87_2061 [Neobacillus sp.]|nr:hypothetical protein [Neobacillus sp.]